MDKQQARTAKTIIILVLVLLFVMGLSLLVINKSPKDYGVFLGKGLLDTWEFRGGRANFSLEDEQENFVGHSMYITDKTRILEATYSRDERDGEVRKLQASSFDKIHEGMFVEIYLENPYEDVTRTAKTIIYWE